jgi:hypothetical protein
MKVLENAGTLATAMLGGGLAVQKEPSPRWANVWSTDEKEVGTEGVKLSVLLSSAQLTTGLFLLTSCTKEAHGWRRRQLGGE